MPWDSGPLCCTYAVSRTCVPRSQCAVCPPRCVTQEQDTAVLAHHGVWYCYTLWTWQSPTRTYVHCKVFGIGMVPFKDGSRYKCLDPQPPLLLSFALGQSSTRCNKVIKTPGGKKTGNQTPNVDKWLPLLGHYFTCVLLVESGVLSSYFLDICISGIPSQNCCRECVMMPKLMTRTQYCWEFSQTQRSQYSGNCFGNFC